MVIFRMKLGKSHFSKILKKKKLTKKKLQSEGVILDALLLPIAWVMSSDAIISVIPTAFATVALPPPSTCAGRNCHHHRYHWQ